MRLCTICDCTEAQNKCKECKYKDECDYFWVSKVWQKNSNLLTPLNPAWAKEPFRSGKIVTITGKYDFCIFNAPRRTDTVTIQDICVDEEGRGQGLSKKLIFGLAEKYDRDIIAKCVEGSSAESFWSHLGEKIGSEPSKQRNLSIYLVRNPKKKVRKAELF